MKKRIVATPRYNDRWIYLNRNIPNDLFYLNAAGITYPDKNFYLKEHYPRHYCVQYIMNGKGFIEYGGKKHETCAGDMFYINATSGVGYGTAPDAPFTKISICGYGIFWKKITEMFGFCDPFGIIRVDDSIIDYFHRVFDIGKAAEENRELGMSAVMALYNRMYDFKCGNILANPRRESDVAAEIKRYIDLHLCEIDKLADIAARFGLSERTVYSKFKSRYDMTPTEYITECRLEVAHEQLCRNDANITAIAEKTGFSGASYFCKVYKDKYGMTPQQYRRSIENGKRTKDS